MRHYFLNMLVFLVLFIAKGQEVNDISEQLPETDYSGVSPSVAMFGKYGDLPVDLSTGQINYSIPLYEIKVGDRTFPITLSYNFNGLKNELPTITGVGWDLLVGGNLTHIKQGGGVGDTFNTYKNMVENYIVPTFQYNCTASSQLLGEDYFELCQASENFSIDTEPDKFIISSPYISGTFYQNHLNKYVFVPQSYNQVEKSGSGYIITDTSGGQYFFNTSENTRTDIESGTTFSSSDSSLSHKLDRISLANNRGDVYFAYDNSKPFDSHKITYSRTFDLSSSATGNYTSTTSATHNIVSGSEKLLTRIDFPNGYMLFKYSNERLADVEVHDASGIIMQYEFVYDTENYLLEHIIKKSAEDAVQPFYSFEYHQPVGVANLGEEDQGTDHWGFINNTVNDYPINEEQLNTAKRSIYNLSGALKKIKYPTNGFTEISYESNISYEVETNIEYSDDIEVSTQSGLYYSDDCGVISVNGNQIVKIDYTINLLPGSEGGMVIINDSTGNNMFMKFLQTENSTTNKVLAGSEELWLESGSYDVCVEYSSGTQGGNISYINVIYNPEEIQTINTVNVGGLRVEQTSDCSETGNCINKYYKYVDENGLSSVNIIDNPKYSEQFSVAHIGDGDPFPNIVNKNYHRLVSNNRALFSTYRGSHIIYDRVETYQEENGAMGRVVKYFTNTNHIGSFSPYAPYLRNDWRRGKLKKEEVYDYDLTLNKYRILSEKENNYDVIYPYGGEGFLINTVTDPTKVVWGFKAQRRYDPQQDFIDVCLDLNYYDKAHYYYVPERYDLVSTSTVQYLENGSVGNTTTLEYHPLNLELASQTTVNSEGETIVITNLYPSDYPSETGMLTSDFNKMLIQNIISPVIKQETFLKVPGQPDKLLTTHVNAYKNWDLDNDGEANDPDDIIRPELVKTVKGTLSASNPIEDRIIYRHYDTKGNPLEVLKADGSPISYIWGYNKEYPIAKIENANFTEIPSGLYSSIVSASNADNGTCLDSEDCKEKDLRNELAKLRNPNESPALSNAMITTYTYDPLIGMTSMTDPKGYTIYYEYDAFNRLKWVKDAQGRIISENVYNYKQ